MSSSRLDKTIRTKRPELWLKHSCKLDHKNALSYISLLVPEFLMKNKTVILPRQPYSPGSLRSSKTILN